MQIEPSDSCAELEFVLRLTRVFAIFTYAIELIISFQALPPRLQDR